MTPDEAAALLPLAKARTTNEALVAFENASRVLGARLPEYGPLIQAMLERTQELEQNQPFDVERRAA